MLGLWWAQLLNNVIATFNAGVAASTTSFESIATVSVGSGGAADIEFTSIPNSYAHLQLRGFLRTTSGDQLRLTFNGSTSNYRSHYLEGTGTSAIAGSESDPRINLYAALPSATSVFSGTVIDILDYANTNKTKVVRALSGWDANGSGYVDLDSGLWNDTSAITSIKFVPSAGSFAQYSHFALYGIKGA